MKWYHTEVAWDKNGLQVYVPVSEPFSSREDAEKAKSLMEDDDFFATHIMNEIDLFKVNCYKIVKCTMINHTGPHTGPEWVFSRTEMLRKGGAVKWFKENYPKHESSPNCTFYRLYWVSKDGYHTRLAER